MQAEELIEQWAQLGDAAAQQAWLAERAPQIDAQLAAAVKDEANRLLRVDIRRSLAAGELLQQLGRASGRPAVEALGLRASADAHASGLGEFQAALERYRAAAAIYQALGDEVDRIRTEASTIWSLASLGQYDAALSIGAAAREQLRAHGQWRPLATLTMNLAIIRGRLGDDQIALELLDDARAIWLTLPEPAGALALIDQNRAILLRNLGQFERSLEASRAAYTQLAGLGQHVEAARAQQNLAVTYHTLGRYNEALQLLDEVRERFRADGRERDTLLVDLFISDCLLQLRRFPDALANCRRARALFHARGVQFEAAQSLLSEAIALAGMQQYDQALAVLGQSHGMFAEQGMPAWAATSDLERAAVLLRQEQFAASLQAAERSQQVFAERRLPLQELRAMLLAARARAALGQAEPARQLAGGATAEAERLQVATLIYQGHHLQGQLAAESDEALAADHFECAMQALERLRAHIMVEFRADFLDDKQEVYEDMAALQIRRGAPHEALAAVERAKSRALRDLLAQRIDLSVSPRSPADLPLTQALDRLQAERNRLVRRWESRELLREDPNRAEQERLQAHQELLAVEQQITEHWHSLLVRNADYAQDSAIWQPPPRALIPAPAEGTLVVEYAELHGRLVAFLLSSRGTAFVHLPAAMGDIERTLRFLWLNLNAVPSTPPERMPVLLRTTRQILQQLYGRLAAPFAQQLKQARRLVFVPHGALHYLPFHALFDGQRYLVEHAECSYLPSAGLLDRATPDLAPTGALVVGYSQDGRLPQAVAEAQAIASMLASSPLLEQDATADRIRAQIGDRRIVHLATHGEFRADSPLFSGLACADGRLTTLDLFSMRLRASLVTLSGCHSGRSVVGGGDELLGMMRACLHSGAASLLVTLWAVDDRATAAFMQILYGELAAGSAKGAALRAAQLAVLRADAGYEHPFFWAPFALVGASGPL
jgi:tetratricopeptide (TPR) repeat protein